MIEMPKFLAEALVKGQCSRFSTCIIDIYRPRHVRSQTGNCDDMSMVIGNHRGKEFLDEKEMSEYVHVECGMEL